MDKPRPTPHPLTIEAFMEPVTITDRELSGEMHTYAEELDDICRGIVQLSLHAASSNRMEQAQTLIAAAVQLDAVVSKLKGEEG